VPLIGPKRIKEVRARFSQLRLDVRTALERTEALQAEVDALRRELAATTVTVGDQIARITAMMELIQRNLTTSQARTDHAPE
jgi:hypothetical protein